MQNSRQVASEELSVQVQSLIEQVKLLTDQLVSNGALYSNREKPIEDADSYKSMQTEHSGKKGVYKAERLRSTSSARPFGLENESDTIEQHGDIVKGDLNKKKDDEISRDFWMHM